MCFFLHCIHNIKHDCIVSDLSSYEYIFLWILPQEGEIWKKTSSKSCRNGNSHLTPVSVMRWTRIRGANNPWRNVEIIERYMCFDQWITFVLTRPYFFRRPKNWFSMSCAPPHSKRKQINWIAILSRSVTHIFFFLQRLLLSTFGYCVVYIKRKKGAKDLLLHRDKASKYKSKWSSHYATHIH